MVSRPGGNVFVHRGLRSMKSDVTVSESGARGGIFLLIIFFRSPNLLCSAGGRFHHPSTIISRPNGRIGTRGAAATRNPTAGSMIYSVLDPDELHKRSRCRRRVRCDWHIQRGVSSHQSATRLLVALLSIVVGLPAPPQTSWALTPIISTTLHRRHNDHRSVNTWSPNINVRSPKVLTRQSPRTLKAPASTKRNTTSAAANSEESLHFLSKRFNELDFLLEEPDRDNSPGSSTENDDPSGTATTPICRVVTRSDRKLPTSKTTLPQSLSRPPYVLKSLDHLFHAHSYAETRRLQYFEASGGAAEPTSNGERDEALLVDVTRTSLEDAGYQLLSRRDLDLCEALNAGYLLRLSILPDVSRLDPTLAREFYPERFDAKGDLLDSDDELLFNGRVLVYWRGYSSENTTGRLVLPKLDYLQASLVQGAAARLVDRLQVLERRIMVQVTRLSRSVSKASHRLCKEMLELIPNKRIASALRKRLASETRKDKRKVKEIASTPASRLFKLARYGGSKIRFVGSPNPKDALDPFMICEQVQNPSDSQCSVTRNIEADIYRGIKDGGLQCPYDQKAGLERKANPTSAMQLLQRVTISSLVDLFSNGGRRALVKSLLAKAELVEPTYDQVVVVWRPLPAKEEIDLAAMVRPPTVRPPKFVYDLADMFDIDGLPERPPVATDRTPERKRPSEPQGKQPLEIRAFSGVPMANVLAVLPRTKLVFRPADAFVFDSISIISFLLVIGSQRFDSPKLDLLALVSVTLWVVRTVFRYSNKLARYDLLVKTFLTSKITHRNRSALHNLVSEAGTQRAVRAALTHSWLCNLSEAGDLAALTRDDLVRTGEQQLNELLHEGEGNRDVSVDVDAALSDLTDLGLAAVSQDGEKVQVLSEPWSVRQALRSCWNKVFDETLKFSSSRRRRSFQTRRGPEDLWP